MRKNATMEALVRSALVVLLGMAGAAPAHAGVIRWDYAVTTQIGETSVAAILVATHRGDEPALHVTTTMEFDGRSKASRASTTVAAGALFSAPASWPRPAGRGTRPLVARMRFQDAAGDSYSATLLHLVSLETNTRSRLSVETAFFRLGPGTERVDVPVEWRGEGPVRARVRFVGPEELGVEAPPAGGAVVDLVPGWQALPLAIGRGRLVRDFEGRGWLVVEVEEDGAVVECAAGVVEVTVVALPPLGAAAGMSGVAQIAFVSLLALVVAGMVAWRRSPKTRA